MILELAGLRAFDRPVAGVVNARRHLVRDQPAARDEELDGQHAGVVEVLAAGACMYVSACFCSEAWRYGATE